MFFQGCKLPFLKKMKNKPQKGKRWVLYADNYDHDGIPMTSHYTVGLTVYVPYATGLILTLSRGSMGGGNSQCDWDNFFAALMQGSDKRGRALGFATFAQELGAKTLRGFVPNGSNAAQKARDRTEPIVGAKVLESFLTRFGIAEVGWPVTLMTHQLRVSFYIYIRGHWSGAPTSFRRGFGAPHQFYGRSLDPCSALTVW